ncbi:hypothetical protein [Acetobacter malorum]|uniref:hypothetical protein n=1 Tax=Acetobacter malorum TaxID=178901 RepID=UPI0039ED81E7
MDAEQADAITALIKKRNPKKSNGSKDLYGISSGFGNDSSYDGKYSAFITRKVPSFVAKFSEKLELLFNQRLLTVRVTNAGDIRADHLVLSIKTSDGWINRRVVAVSASGPTAPVPRPDYLSSLNIHRHLENMMPPRVGRHEFETTLRARRSRETKACCEDFHSGQDYYFEGVVAPTSRNKPLEITVTLTAKNLRGKHTKVFKIDKQIVAIEPGELVHLQTLKLKQDYPAKEELAQLLRAKEYDKIDWDEKDED